MSPTLVPVILCGGAGSRLWPVSRQLLPKQFHSLVGEQSLLQQTAGRLAGLACTAPLMVCNSAQRFLAAEQLRACGIVPAAMLLEPVSRNTAPAVAVAAHSALARDPEATLLVLAADHSIADVPAFHRAIGTAQALAAEGSLVTFGMPARSAETGYGYIERGAPVGGHPDAFRIARFTEKPDRRRAEHFVRDGRHFWNSGMFLFRAARFLEELQHFSPEIAQAAHAAWRAAKPDLDFIRLDQAAFEACPAESIDYAVMERTSEGAVVAAEIGWTDVGSWGTLWAIGEKDGHGNVTHGDVDIEASENCYVRSDGRFISVLGLRDVVVVDSDDALLVADRARSQEVKGIVERLQSGRRSEALMHRRVYRPWGYYESLSAGENFQAKLLMVKPGCALSLQLHHKRAEHWVVVSGMARVTRGDESFDLSVNQSTYIPIGAQHRLHNPGEKELLIVEVQSGSYLGEDDIVRLDDEYGRIGEDSRPAE